MILCESTEVLTLCNLSRSAFLTPPVKRRFDAWWHGTVNPPPPPPPHAH
jgi:hypothetical protein